MLPKGLRFSAGLVIGAVLWWYATPAYDTLLAVASTPLVHLDHRYRTASLLATGRSIRVTGRSIPPATVPVDQYTASGVLLLALFAMRRDLFHDRGIRAFAFSLLVVAVMHTLAVVIGMESTYAVRTPDWGDRNYSGTAQDFWQAAEFVYRIGAMFAVPFACYWLASVRKEKEETRGGSKARKKKRR